MPPVASSRFGPHIISGPFSQIQQSHLAHHSQQQQQQQQQPGSAALPAPAFNNGHHGFAHGNPSSVASPFGSTSSGNGIAGPFGSANGLASGGSGLASQAAVMGFAQGAAMQARDALRRSIGGTGSGKGQMKGRIRDVWRGNLAQEMTVLRSLIDKYPYISMVRFLIRRPLMISDHSTNSINRTPSFLASLLGRWVHSQQRPTIITKPFAVTSIFCE